MADAVTLPPLDDPERALALAYVPKLRRRALQALWALDEMLASIVAQAREPTLAQIRLAWWREALLTLGGRGPAPVDPLLRALDALVAPLVAPERLAPLAEGWGALLGELDEDALTTHATERGATLFLLSAELLGDSDFVDTARAGRLWSLADAARRLDGVGQRLALDQAGQEISAGQGTRWPTPLRPLGMLATLAASDARDPISIIRGAPRRVARMIAHRLTGRAGLGAADGAG